MASQKTTDNLNAGSVASIVEDSPNVFSLYIRTKYEDNLNTYSFVKHKQVFTSLAQAKLAYQNGWPNGYLVDFNVLTTFTIPVIPLNPSRIPLLSHLLQLLIDFIKRLT